MSMEPEKTVGTASIAGLFDRAFHAPLSRDLARWLLTAELPREDVSEVNRLLHKNREGSLTKEEAARLETYIEFDDALGALKSKARQSLNGELEPSVA